MSSDRLDAIRGLVRSYAESKTLVRFAPCLRAEDAQYLLDEIDRLTAATKEN